MDNLSSKKSEQIIKLINKHEKKFIQMFVDYGPVDMQQKLELNKQEWKLVFDHLVLEKNAIKRCVLENADFIHDLFKNHGPTFIRELFQIEDQKYQDAWDYIMDYIGISRGAIFEFVNLFSSHFRDYIQNGKTEKIRKYLMIENEKYTRVWENILDILLENVCTHQFSHSMFEQGLKMFNKMYSIGRSHRSLKRFNQLSDIQVADE